MGNTASSFSAGIEDEVRMVMVGKTGSGKSATGNSILQKDFFTSSSLSSSCTKNCRRGDNIYDTGSKKYNLIVVDTPGLFDTGMPNEQVPLAVRFTPEEAATALHFRDLFGEKLLDFMVIVFSHGDNIEKEVSIEQIVAEAPQPLKQLLKQCGNRYVVFNNKNASKDKKKKQLKTLMEVIEKMITNNDKSFYTDEMFKEAEEALQERMEELKKENEQLQAVDLRKTVRKEVEEEKGTVLSNIGQGILAAGQNMATAAIEATGVPSLLNGLSNLFGQ